MVYYSIRNRLIKITKFFTGAKVLQQIPIKILLDKKAQIEGKRNIKRVKGKYPI
jgi:hypothetical protein